MAPDGLLGVGSQAAADYLGVSVGSIRRWADEGQIRYQRTPGGQRRFRRPDLDAFARRTRVEPRQDPLPAAAE